MMLTDFVLGRRAPRRARSDLIAGIVAARRGLEMELDVRAAALVFEPWGLSGDAAVGRELDALLAGIAEDTKAEVAQRDDGFGLRWVTLSGGSLDDLALSIGVLAEALRLAGQWAQLVCAVFVFHKGSNPTARVFWIYSFERGTFYPFVPRDDARRDSEEEARLWAAVEDDLPLEHDPQRWHPLWGIPI